MSCICQKHVGTDILSQLAMIYHAHPEGRALRKANAKTLAKFFWEEILCRYGAVGQVVTDTDQKSEAHSRISQIAIASLKSRFRHTTPKLTESWKGAILLSVKQLSSHREGQCEQMARQSPPSFFADKVTTSRVTGFTPFYLLHGMDPVLPFDLMESTFPRHRLHLPNTNRSTNCITNSSAREARAGHT